jgi:hypothetical protein
MRGTEQPDEPGAIAFKCSTCLGRCLDDRVRTLAVLRPSGKGSACAARSIVGFRGLHTAYRGLRRVGVHPADVQITDCLSLRR